MSAVGRTPPRLLGWTAVPAVAALALLMIHTILNTVARITGAPLDGTLEYGAFWYLPIIAFLGLVIAQRNGEQIEATLVYDRLTPAGKRELTIIGYVFVILLALGYLWFGWQEAVGAAEIQRTAGSSDVLIWPAMFVVPLGCLLLVIQLVVDLVNTIRGRAGYDAADNEIDEGATL